MGRSKSFALLLAVVILVPGNLSAGTGEHLISGRLNFDGSYPCDHVQMALEGINSQKIDMTTADFGCNFSFSPVASGTYYIHITLDGFEEIYQRVDVTSQLNSTGIAINMHALTARVVNSPSSPGDPDPGIMDASEFLDRYPKKAVSLYRKALDNSGKGKNTEAISELEQAIAIAPTFYRAHNELGLLYRAVGRNDAAEGEFLRAHQLNENSAEPLIYLSSLYMDEQKPTQAVQYSEQAVKTNSRSAPAFFNLGLALYKASMLDRAEDALKRALDLAPRMGQIRLALTNIYLRQRRYDRALDQLNAYFADRPAAGPQRSQAEHLRDQLIKDGGK